jgi:hypothetical protein
VIEWTVEVTPANEIAAQRDHAVAAPVTSSETAKPVLWWSVWDEVFSYWA